MSKDNAHIRHLTVTTYCVLDSTVNPSVRACGGVEMYDRSDRATPVTGSPKDRVKFLEAVFDSGGTFRIETPISVSSAHCLDAAA